MAEHTTGKGRENPAEQSGNSKVEGRNKDNKALDTRRDKASVTQNKQPKNEGPSILDSDERYLKWIKRGRSLAVPIAELIFTVGLVFAVVEVEKFTVMQALPLWIVGGATLAFLIQLYFAIQDQNGVRFEFFSGGLEGSLGGWEMSRSLAYVFLVAAFGAVFIVMLPDPDSQGNNLDEGGNEPTEQVDQPGEEADNSSSE